MAALSLRGAESNFTVVLIDGVQVNDPTNTRGGSFDFSTIDINDVHRIELLSGAAAAVYGSDALAGVVNVITYDPSDQQTTISVGGGEAGLRQAGVRSTLVNESLGSLHIAASFTEDDNPSAQSTYRAKSLRANYDQQHLRHTFGVQLAAAHSDQQVFPEDSGGRLFAVLSERDLRDVDSGSVALRYGYDSEDAWDLEAFASHYSREEDYQSPGIAGGARDPFGIPPNQAKSKFQRSLLRVHGERQYGSIDVLAGAQWLREQGDSDGEVTFIGPVNFDIERDTFGAFAEFYSEPLTDVSVTLGLRLDKAESESAEATYKLDGSYRVVETAELFASIGTGYKLPSFFALANPLVGNPLLSPETVRTVQAGVRGTGPGQLQYELAGFRSEYQDLIDFDSDLFTNVNRSDVSMSGWDLTASGALGEQFRYRLFFSYVDIDVEPTGKLRQRPQWRWGGAFNLAITPSMTANVQWQYNDQRFDSSVPNPEVVLDAYQRVDLALHWSLRPGWQLTLALDNALNESYADADGFRANGRRARAGVRLSF